MQLPIYFFGDNHFSPTPSLSNEQKIRKLEQFIDVIENSGGSIFIMGDFFDYYFEYNINNPNYFEEVFSCLLYTSPSPRDVEESRMPSSA